MDKIELEQYIAEAYGVNADFPWIKSPENKVFRHANNKKWFALVMPVLKRRLGLTGEGELDILTLKCDPLLIGSYLYEPGFFPAYHMNKTNWISISLDHSVGDDIIKQFLDFSFGLTRLPK